MKGILTIRDLGTNNKPRERMLIHGPEALSDSELLAVILRSGDRDYSAINLAGVLLKEFDGFKGLINADVRQLMRVKGIGVAKACSIKSVCEICLRMKLHNPFEGVEIKKPQDIYDLIKKDLFSKKKEHLYLFSLDVKSKVISKDLVSIGTITETLVDCREIFKIALLKNACSIILVHNHPSSGVEPSNQDVEVTKRVARAGIVVGIPLVDHVIISDSDYLSLKSSNYLSFKKGGD